MNDTFSDIAKEHGYEFNKQNGAYIHGKKYNHDKKLEVAAAIKEAQCNQFYLAEPKINISAIQRQCKVGWHFVKKVEKELEEYGRVLHPEEVRRKNEDECLGPGSKTLDEMDVFAILQLYHDEPSRNLRSYVRSLNELTGTVVSESTISRFFKEQFPYSATFCQTNFVPLDKFRPENMFRAVEYLYLISRVDPSRIKFGDEKSLKGKEVFNRKVRRNPLTGEVPPLFTTPDLTNTYSLTGFCGIDKRSTAVWCSIHDDTNDAAEFALQVELALQSGFFRRGDIIVLDNAKIHIGGENTVLEDWLWNNFGIFALFLPPRSPEWNPMELVWNTLVQRLKLIPMRELREAYGTQHCSAEAAIDVMSDFTHEEVYSFFKKCNVV